MYNRTLSQIDRLHDNLDDIRNSIRGLETNTSTRFSYNNTRPVRNTNLPFETNANTNTNTNQVYMNGRYYNIEYIQPNLNIETDRREILRTGIHNILERILAQENFNEPVIVRPSEREIQNSTISTNFCSIINPINNSCPISLDRFHDDSEVTQIIYCGHVFNTSDLNVWFERNVRCPVCRYDIRRYGRRSHTAGERESPRQNVNVENNNTEDLFLNTNVQYNANEDITFDISGNPFVNLATQALNDLIRNPQPIQNANSLFDVSNNPILLFETILRRQP